MLRRLRLLSGLVLFVYLLTHALNHALGLVSLEALEAGRLGFLALWRNLPASLLLYAALLTHAGLAFWSLYQRRRLAMPAWEATQLVFGLAIPPLLILHVLGSRFSHEVFGLEDTYTNILLIFFKFNPPSGLRQATVLLVAWVHGCIGLHFWLRLKPWYRRFVPLAYAGALLVPALALLGTLVAGREVLRLAEDPGWLAATLARVNALDSDALELVYGLERGFLIGFALLLALTFAARALRARWQRRHGIITLGYPDGRRVEVLPGTTILEASRGAGIPHASICGGRGRCSTCRVRIAVGLEQLPPPSEAEAQVLARIGAATNVRLACQTRPAVNLAITPLLPPTASPREARPRPGYLQGEEREVAILFADLRDFTALSEDKLPYDVVFLLNRYFAGMGMAVEEAGGRVDKFIGDGVMALFGLERGGPAGCREALDAAWRMGERLMELNVALKDDLPRPLRIGIGIHVGAAIVGEMGYGRATSLTAVGDAVNTASRLETLTKELDAQLVLSEPVAETAGVDLSDFPRREIELRGKTARLAVRVVANARSLPRAEIRARAAAAAVPAAS